MSADHVTLRIPKRALLITAALVLVPGAFVAGLAVGGDDSTSVLSDTTVPAMSSTTFDTIPETSTTAKPTPTPTTVAKKKASTTTTAPIAVTVTYTDDCPPANTANNRVNGTMTVTWKSTSAVAATLEIMHGADFDYSESNHPASGTYTTVRMCNNVRLADGSYPGRPLTVVYRVTVRDAAGKTAVAGGNDSM